MPAIIPAEGASPSYMSYAASWPISRNGAPGSSRPSPRSRGRSLPGATWAPRDLRSPPCGLSVALARRSAIWPSSASRLLRKSSDRVSMREVNAAMRVSARSRRSGWRAYRRIAMAPSGPDRRGVAMIRVTAHRWVPPFAQGLVRDLRVRWALEEAGLPYEEQLIGPDDQKSDRYRALQPFGQVPVLEEDDAAMFESGAIVLHIAERSAALMPEDARERERVRTWMFAALNTIEPPVTTLGFVNLQPGGVTEGTKPLRDWVAGFVSSRLDSLVKFLGDR